MARPKIITSAAVKPHEVQLELLERAVIEGQRALERRNALIVDLHAEGVLTKAAAFHRLNYVRSVLGAEPLTRSAVDVIIRRDRARRDAPEAVAQLLTSRSEMVYHSDDEHHHSDDSARSQ
jgi:hypothetical protein